MANVRASACITAMRLPKGDAAQFAAACCAASASMSMASMCACGLRCAAINAIRPVPVPMSSMRRASSMWHHAPSSTPSVPTFMAQRSWAMSNCLNEKRVIRGGGYRLVLYEQRALPLAMLVSLPLMSWRRMGEMRSVKTCPSRWSYSCCMTRAKYPSTNSSCACHCSSK